MASYYSDDWDKLADWYDKKQGDTGDLWHRSLIDPVLIGLVGDVKGKHLLDLGCGNGYLSRRFARGGATVTAIDKSERMISNAKKHDPAGELPISYHVSPSNDLNEFGRDSFDIVVANMTLMDIEDGSGTIAEIGRVLRSGGFLVASISHPCFDNGRSSSWAIEKNYEKTLVYRKIRAYRNPSSEDFPWKISDNEIAKTRGYHRPLNWYAQTLFSQSLAIVALEEPEPTAEFLEKEDDALGFLEVPLHLVIKAQKLN